MLKVGWLLMAWYLYKV